MASKGITKKTNADFLHYCLKRVWMANGASEEHADTVADGLMIGIRQRKLTQGLGVWEALDMPLQQGQLDINAEPEMIKEGPTWSVFDGHKSSGYWTLTKMVNTTIAKAKKHGLAIAFGHNHCDAGSFGAYTWMAYQQDCVALCSNNSVGLASPYGAMGRVLAGPPLDAIGPGGDKPPVWMSTMLQEWHDGHVAQAALDGTKVKDNTVIDPDTGELGNDLAPYAVPVEGYGRVFNFTCFQNLPDPRIYVLNLWNEMMTAVINPGGIIAPEIPDLDDVISGKAEGTPVGGSYFLCIDPSVFGPIEDVKAKSDRLAQAVEDCKPLPGRPGARMPGSGGWKSLMENSDEVEVLASHWEPWFKTQAGRHGWTEESLRADWEAQKK